jgi:hypothetical protein
LALKVPKFTDGAIASPMVTFVDKNSLHSFKDKRKELNGQNVIGSVAK